MSFDAIGQIAHRLEVRNLKSTIKQIEDLCGHRETTVFERHAGIGRSLTTVKRDKLGQLCSKLAEYFRYLSTFYFDNLINGFRLAHLCHLLEIQNGPRGKARAAKPSGFGLKILSSINFCDPSRVWTPPPLPSCSKFAFLFFSTEDCRYMNYGRVYWEHPIGRVREASTLKPVMRHLQAR